MGAGGDLPTFHISPGVAIGHVHLRVRDIDGSLGFYRDLLGLRSVGNPRGEVVYLSPNGEDPYLLAIEEAGGGGGPAPGSPGRRAGLYHFALLLPGRRYLASAVGHLLEHRERVYIEGAADHGVSESLYIRDPDLHGIEITWDRPRVQWRRGDHGFEMGTWGLDLDRLVEEADPAGWRGPPPGTAIGHVHLHVTDLPRAFAFYTQGLGFHPTAEMPGARFFAAGGYHHHVATNVWHGEGIPPAADEGPGLDHFALRLPSEGDLRRTLEHLRRVGVEVEMRSEEGPPSAFLRDPDRIRIQLFAT